MDAIMPSLFAVSELPVMAKPTPVINGMEVASRRNRQSKEAREADKKKAAEMQFDLLLQLLSKPLIKSIQKSSKHKLDNREVSPVFTGSITTLERPRLSTMSVDLDWSNENLLELHQWIFEEAFESLKSDDNAKEKMDILEWIYSPAYIDKIGKSLDGRPCVIRRHASDIPFSFENCCRAMGFANPDNFRESLVEVMDGTLQVLLRKYINTTGNISNKMAVKAVD